MNILIQTISRRAHLFQNIKVTHTKLHLKHTICYHFGDFLKVIKRNQLNQDKESNHHVEAKNLHEEMEDPKELIYQFMFSYPFSTKSPSSVNFYQNAKIEEQQKRILIAWRCLIAKSSAELKQAESILLPENYHLNFTSSKKTYDGQLIFTIYYQKQLKKLISTLNSTQISTKMRISILNVLVHMKKSKYLMEYIQKIDTQFLKGMNSGEQKLLIFAFLVNLNAKNRLSYDQYIPLLEIYLKKKQFSFIKVRIAYILTLTPFIHKLFSTPFIKQLSFALKKSLPFLSTNVILYYMKKFHQNNPKLAKQFMEELMKYVMKIDKNEDKIKDFIPLLINIVKSCMVLDVPCQHFILYLVDHIDQYSLGIQKENTTKDILISRLLQQYEVKLSATGVQIIQNFAQKKLKEYQYSKQIDEKEYSEFARVLNKYMSIFSNELKQDICVLIFNLLSQIDLSEQKFIYESLNTILSLTSVQKQLKQLFEEQKIDTVRKLATKYVESNCQKFVDGMHLISNINECINLISKAYFSEIKLNVQAINLCRIRFKELPKYSMSLETFENLVKYLSSQVERINKEDLKLFFYQSEYIILTFFNRKKVNYQTTIELLSLASSYKDRTFNIYPRIIDSINQHLMNNPEFIISEKDLQILKKNLVNKYTANKQFNLFVNSCLESHEKWSSVRNKYVSSLRESQQKSNHRKPK